MPLEENLLESYMNQCIEAALRSSCVKRPFVGALVISKYEKILSLGIKELIPGTTNLYIHAERSAILKAGLAANEGTLVTTLEPCVMMERKKTFSPCSELIVKSGIKRVIIGMKDPSPFINGRGIKYLVNHGIIVETYTKEDSRLRSLLKYFDR